MTDHELHKVFNEKIQILQALSVDREGGNILYISIL